MGRKHDTEEEIAFALRQAESGTPAAEIIRKRGVSEQTLLPLEEAVCGGLTVKSSQIQITTSA